MRSRYVPLNPGDSTWRILRREVPETRFHPEIDGRECYVFQRTGGERPTDEYTIHVIPVELFWGAPCL